jgi:hypothetical protein
MTLRTLPLLLLLACHTESSLGSAAAPPEDSIANPRPVFGENKLWEIEFPGNTEESAWALKILPSGDLITSFHYGLREGGMIDVGDGPRTTASSSWLLMRRSRLDGSLQWIREGVGGRVAIDPAGDVIVIGTFEGTVDFGGQTLTTEPIAGTPYSYSSAYIAKYAAADGALLWVRAMGAEISYAGSAPAIGPDGTVFAAFYRGATEVTPANPPGAYLIAISSSGVELWSKTYSAPDPIELTALATTPDGDLITAFHVRAPFSFGGNVLGAHGTQLTVLARLSPSGDYLWSMIPPELPSPANFWSSVVVAPSGDFYITQNGWLRAFDASGSELWHMRPAVNTHDVLLAPDGTLLVGGSSGRDLGLGWVIPDGGLMVAVDPDGRAADQTPAFAFAELIGSYPNGDIAYVGLSAPLSILDRVTPNLTLGIYAAPSPPL